MSFSVTGKTALVTGAGSGIGVCFAKLLLERNCNVVIADLALRPEAEALVREYSRNSNQSRPRAIFVKTDVTSWDDLNRMFDTVDKEFGGADIVCPGAGVFEPSWSTFWQPPGTGASKDVPTGIGHYAILDINLTHPIRTTQIAISRWLNPTKGKDFSKVSPANPKRIVHITSVSRYQAFMAAPLYHASKHALVAFVRTMAPLDKTLGIRVNGVAPGSVKTPLWTDSPDKIVAFDPAQDEWITPEEVASQMLRCCESDEMGGGYIMEVLKGRQRHVPLYNNSGPSGPGASLSGGRALLNEAFQRLAEPGWGQVNAVGNSKTRSSL